jgi:predicted DNA-binding protein
MSSKGSAKSERKRIGRPPAGQRAGERVKDYPQLSVRVPGDVKAKLHAISVVSERPQWRIITEAIDCYLRDRSDAERRRVSSIAKRTPGRSHRN